LKGVVTLIEQKMGLTSIFGLWNELLAFDIIWRRAGHPKFLPENVFMSNDKRAPSWSWAKLDSTIDCHEVSQYSEALMYAISFQYCPPKTDAEQQFQYNDPPHCLKISAPLADVSFIELKFDVHRHMGSMQNGLEAVNIWLDEPQTADALVGCALHLLFICRKQRQNTAKCLDVSPQYIVALLLQRMPKSDSYRRIGLVLDSTCQLSVPSEISNITLF
jgi:hypothetical protein